MAKQTELITVVEKSREWLKNVLGVTDDFITLQNIGAFPIVYVYEMLPYGGGDDQIKMVAFKEVLTNGEVQKRFTNSKIRGHLNGPICQINLRSGSY